jgi:GMP synthase-like glutamine amidotransferase
MTLDPVARDGIFLQNEFDAPPGLLGEWCGDRGIGFTVVEAWRDGVPDDPREFGWICALGAEDSTNQSEPAWIPREIAFLAEAVEAGVPVLGICFGGQALARAMGARVSPAPRLCAGWYEVRPEPGADLLTPGPWIHYNQEHFEIPQGAIKLGEGPNGPAGYTRGPHVGLQLHPEATPEILEDWVSRDPDLPAAGIDPDDIRADTRRYAEGARRQAFALFDRWWDLVNREMARA